MKLVFLEPVQAEFLEPIAFYEAQQAGLRRRFLNEIELTLGAIREMPMRFPLVRPTLRRAGIRHFPVAIFFRANDVSIEVVAVAPHRRRPGYWRKR